MFNNFAFVLNDNGKEAFSILYLAIDSTSSVYCYLEFKFCIS